MAELLIHDGNWQQHANSPFGHAKGCTPRDWTVQPHGYNAYAPAFNLPLIPQNEWQPRLDALKANNARLSDIRKTGAFGAMIPSRDQNGMGYCWKHSGTSAMLLARAKAGFPYADLSAYAGACIIKNYRDEGGNGIDGVEFDATRGCPTSQFWPQQSMSRANDNPATWANAALHKDVAYLDLDPSNMKAQLVTCLLMNIPVVVDYDWWGHSVCAADLENLDPFTVRIWNSWGDSWSDNGMGLLQSSRAMPDNAVAVMIVTPAQI